MRPEESDVDATLADETRADETDTEEQPRQTPKKGMTAQMGAEPNPMQMPPPTVRKTPSQVKTPTPPPDVKPQTEATAPLGTAPKKPSGQQQQEGAPGQALEMPASKDLVQTTPSASLG